MMTSAPSTRKRGRPTVAERAARCAEILDAAVRLFADEGFARVTFDRIASEARVTKRTIYSFFDGREEIFRAAVERLRSHTMAADVADAQELGDLCTRIVHVLHSDEAVKLHRMVISESGGFPELAEQFYADGPQAYIRALADALPPAHGEHAESLFALLLGEPHRQRLLGLREAPDLEQARVHAQTAMSMLGLEGCAPSERRASEV